MDHCVAFLPDSNLADVSYMQSFTGFFFFCKLELHPNLNYDIGTSYSTETSDIRAQVSNIVHFLVTKHWNKKKLHLDLCVQNQKAGMVLENFTPEPEMYFFFFHFVGFFFSFRFVYYVCQRSLFLETGYEMLRIYM